jgi:hypothetical protein
MHLQRATPTAINSAGAMINVHWATGNRPSTVQVVSAAGVAGAALTAPFAGAFPFTNPTSGDTLIAQLQMRMSGATTANGPGLLIDRLWQNNGLDRTLTTAQTVNSVAFPARDKDGSTNGEGVYIAVETSVAMGTGVPALSMSYTNSTGTAGKTGNGILAAVTASSPAGYIFIMGLAAGDTGVRSIQTFTNSVTWGASGSLQLVAFRPLAMINNKAGLGNLPRGKATGYEDATTLGRIKLYDNSCLQFWAEIAGSGANSVSGQLTLSQG